MLERRIESNKLKRFCAVSAEYSALALTFLLPLKFASMVSAPEMPSSYWFDAASIILTPWPVALFPLLSALMLGLSLFAYPWSEKRFCGGAGVWGGCFLLLGIVSFAGLSGASAKIFAYQMLPHSLGVCSYALGLLLLCGADSRFRSRLLYVVLAGGLASVVSGLNQYFTGFDELTKYVEEMNRNSSSPPVTGQLASRIAERRLSGDFGICNTYGGFMGALLPFAVWIFSDFGRRRVTPAKVSSVLLGLTALVLFAFPMIQSGSRGALFSLICGCACFGLFYPKLGVRMRVTAFAVSIAAFAGFAVIVASGRGFNSMFFRFDYFQAAFRMMCDSPFFGTGWGDFFHDFLSYKTLVNTEGPHSPHNFILLFASQCGVGGFIAAFAVLVFPCVLALLAYRRGLLSPRMSGVALSLVVFGVDSLVEISFESPAFFGYFAAMGAILCTDESVSESRFFKFASGRWYSYFVMICGGVTLLACIFSSVYFMRTEKAFSEFNELLDQRFSRGGIGSQAITKSKVSYLAGRVPLWNPFAKVLYADYLWHVEGANRESVRLLDEAIEVSPLRAAFYLKRARMEYALSRDVSEEVKAYLSRARHLSPKNPDYMKSDIELLTVTE